MVLLSSPPHKLVCAQPFTMEVHLEMPSHLEGPLSSKGGDKTSCRKLKWKKRKDKDKLPLCCFYHLQVRNPLECGTLWAPSAHPPSTTATLKKINNPGMCLTCLPPIWLFIPSEQPFHSLTPRGEWVWEMLRLSSRLRLCTGFVHSCLPFSSCFSIDKTHCTWLGLHD